jgi:DNA-binding response OmpR family regulator
MPGNLKVLIVDDAAFIREMVRRTLRSRFPTMQIEDVVNGRKAQQLLEKAEFDLVLCDWEMPEMSGIELLSWVRQERKSRVPFVMVTSRGDKENVIEAIQAGVSDYIGKPFSSDSLINKVTKVLSKHHNMREQSNSAPRTNRPGDGSLDALGARAGASKTAAAQKKPQASKAASQPKPVATKGPANLRFGDTTNACEIKALSLKQIELICPVEPGLPAILETVVVDLQQGSGEESDIARINAFVHKMQANNPSINCDSVTISVTIVDQDPNKLSYLSRMIAKGTTQSGYIPAAT